MRPYFLASFAAYSGGSSALVAPFLTRAAEESSSQATTPSEATAADTGVAAKVRGERARTPATAAERTRGGRMEGDPFG